MEQQAKLSPALFSDDVNILTDRFEGDHQIKFKSSCLQAIHSPKNHIVQIQ